MFSLPVAMVDPHTGLGINFPSNLLCSYFSGGCSRSIMGLTKVESKKKKTGILFGDTTLPNFQLFIIRSGYFAWRDFTRVPTMKVYQLRTDPIHLNSIYYALFVDSFLAQCFQQ